MNIIQMSVETSVETWSVQRRETRYQL
jgi:hypothetical protein